MRKTLIALGLLATAAAGGLAASSAASGSAKMAAMIAQLDDNSSGDDWPGTGRTYNEQQYSPLAQVTDRNVGQLGLAWSVDLGFGNSSTQPVEVGGVVYFTTGMSVVRAVDVRSGKLLWTFDPEVGKYGGKEMRQQWGTRGIAWWNGRVYTGTVDGRLIAIDGKTGKQVWSVKTTQPGQFITGAPRVFRNKVIIGQGGSDSTLNRGYVTAYDADTGKQVWRFYIVPGNPENGFENKAMAMAAKTWTGEWWRWGGGGSPWNAMTYDAELNQVLIGTGNGYPWNRHLRSPGGGDNLFLCSILALDADTGEYKWHYQINPGDSWDFNAAMGNMLADLKIDGKMRKVIMTAPKNGFFYVIDRTNGALISTGKIAAKVTWASHIDQATGRPVEDPDARYPDGKDFELWPSPRGAHSWMPTSYSPRSGLVYIPTIEHGVIFNDRGITMDNWRPFGANLSFPQNDPIGNTSSLLAWDPVRQKKVWQIPFKGGWTGGALSTAGNLVFQGHLDGRFVAYAADTGKELWRFPAQAAILAAPISYRVDGRQYVSVMVGLGGSAATEASSHGGITIDGRTQKNRILTFVLGGKAKLPPAPPPFVVKPVDDPDYKPDPALTAKGEAVYNRSCLNCHGLDTIAAGWAPDLRGSPVPQSAEAFAAIVRDGGLVATGMPRFDDLPEADIQAVRQYLRSRGADLRAGKQETPSSRY